MCILSSGGDDYDFGGIGVNVYLNGTITIKNGREIWAKVTASLYQTKTTSSNPYTEGKVVYEDVIWSAPSGQKIVSLNKSKTVSKVYTDYDNAVDFIWFSNSCFDHFEVNAETEGPDLGECTYLYSYLSVFFSDITVTLAPQ